MRKIFNGIAVSSGIAIGRARFINRRGSEPINRKKISPCAIEKEYARFERAIKAVDDEFEQAIESLSAQLSAGDGLDTLNTPESTSDTQNTVAAGLVPPHHNQGRSAQLLREQVDMLHVYSSLCRDPKLMEITRNHIASHRVSVDWALEKTVQDIAEAFRSMDSDYFRDRISDVQTVVARINQKLRGTVSDVSFTGDSDDDIILFAHDLTPADTLTLPTGSLGGLVTEMGGRTSHTGILARSMHIPCLVGISGLEEAVRDGDPVILDGLSGLVVLNPDAGELDEFFRKKAHFAEYEAKILKKADAPAETEDGVLISVYGNVEIASETVTLKGSGAEGVGLFRTEFGYLSRNQLPLENELYEEYRSAIEAMKPNRVVLRTLDLGADKQLGNHPPLEEDNPALGLRAIRYCFRHQDIFRRQLRAILRAGYHGNAALMFPMISGVGEFKAARAILYEVKQELTSEGAQFDANIPLGTMIELPSAVIMAEELAREVDFFSIGTNDLIQYSLGIDRGNKYVSYLYQPLHPAIIRAIKHVTDMAHAAGIPVCVCGEMASDPVCLPLLLGMGIDELSMTGTAIPAIKNLIRHSNVEEFRQLLGEAFNTKSARETGRLVRQSVYSRFREELLFYSAQAEFSPASISFM